MGTIVTFYSYKGGVGRTIALANIAVLLSRKGYRVLAVDWDLEAPGLSRYFKQFGPSQNVGLLDLLLDSCATSDSDQPVDWRDYVSELKVGGKQPLTLMPSGRQDDQYASRVLRFDWSEFFESHDGGQTIEVWRNEWRDKFDFVLIDSRTGFTDSGGICTIQLPDVLALVFTANEQSVLGAKDIAIRSQKARQKLAYDRMSLTVFPMPSRFDSRTEHEESQKWLQTFAKEMEPFYADWLPKWISPRAILEATKLPYVAYFSFGEKLPVVSHGTSDPESLGYGFDVAASLIASNLDVEACHDLLRIEFPSKLKSAYKAIVLSTFADLKDHRAHVIRSLRSAGIFVDAMEDWTANADEPKHVVEKHLEGCDLCVLIVGFRRGYVPNGESKSILELEYKAALNRGIDTLVFLLDEDAPWPRRFDELDSDPATKGWRNELIENHAVSFFGMEPDSLEIASAVSRWLAEKPSLPSRESGKYLAELSKQCSSIDIRGLTVGSGRANRFPIDELYIPLSTVTGEGHQSEKTELFESLLSCRRAVIIGDPGSGKTTFLRRLTWMLCRSSLGEQHRSIPAKFSKIAFPMYIPLASFVEHQRASHDRSNSPTTENSPAWIAHFLATVSQEGGIDLDEEFFQRQLEDGSATLLLDGFDEVPTDQSRRAVAKIIENVANAFTECQIVATTRPVAYADETVLPGFATFRIEPLEDEAISRFLNYWSSALFGDDAESSKQHARDLDAAFHSRAEIRRLARNPVMLTALAVVHWNERRLPEQRADLYESIVGWLARSRERRPGRKSPETCVSVLQQLALAMQDHAQGRQTQVRRRWAAEQIADLFREEIDASTQIHEAERFLNGEELDSGIVVGRGDDIRFWHLTFQEYLAARAIAALSDDRRDDVLLSHGKLYRPEWREVVLLLAGVLHHQGIVRVDSFVSAIIDQLGTKPVLAEKARCAGTLGAIVADLAPVNFRPGDPRFLQILDSTMAVFDASNAITVPIVDAIAAADALGQAGDPRFSFRNLGQNWVTVPAGFFLMGSQDTDPQSSNFDSDANADEMPVHQVHLDEFMIGRFPVTVGEYRRFVENDGYQDATWWMAGGFGEWDSPEHWSEQTKYPNRPICGVSWYEATAYAQWMGARLPTEAEWERAARGGDSRRFPWGNELNESCLNYNGEHGRPTPVGVFPLGATPDGILDMAGNVYEWCADWYGEYEDQSIRNPTGLESGEGRVLRGGGWIDEPRFCRSSFRLHSRPGTRQITIGFRLVRSGGVKKND